MSKNLERVIQRAISDAAFRRQLQSNPEAALRGFKLTESEVAALRSGDAGKLTSLGIDQRMSKTFTFGAADLASRASTGGDLSSAGLSQTDQDVRLNSAESTGGGSTGSAIIAESGSDEGRLIPGVGAGATSIGDPMSSGIAASNIGDPDNPASARGYVGDQAASAPTSDAIEDQSHAFAATRSADVSASGMAAPIEGTPEEFSFREQGASTGASVIADPDNPAAARGYVGEPGASTSTASFTADPDNPAAARGYVGDQTTAPTSDALEDQSHAIAARGSGDAGSAQAAQVAPLEGTPEEFAFRDQSTSNASIITDPDNPANARGYTGEQPDAFLAQSEAGQYSADPNWSSDQAEDIGHAFNPDGSEVSVDEVDTTTSARNGPDIPV